jgi:hypothetical protein
LVPLLAVIVVVVVFVVAGAEDAEETDAASTGSKRGVRVETTDAGSTGTKGAPEGLPMKELHTVAVLHRRLQERNVIVEVTKKEGKGTEHAGRRNSLHDVRNVAEETCHRCAPVGRCRKLARSSTSL